VEIDTCPQVYIVQITESVFMVKIREHHKLLEDGPAEFDHLIAFLEEQVPDFSVDRFRDAARQVEAAERRDLSLNPIRDHRSRCLYVGLEMVEILAGLQMDEDALLAGLLYRGVREGLLDIGQVRSGFGDVVANLVRGVLRMATISNYQRQLMAANGQVEDIQLGKVRRMLVDMIEDVRVALIKIAERTAMLRAVKARSDEKRRDLAREVFHVYAPLAHRLGIGQLKWELEDISFRYLHPEEYHKIAGLLDEKRIDRQDYIDRVATALHDSIGKAGIEADISGRAKHIYSIWRKMRRKGIPFEQVYDVRAFRVLVPEVRDCYAVLGVVHGLWRAIPGEFDDYVASPKSNGYQSLHTAVLGPEGKVVEIQIRTHEMHASAELGVCAHWRYKGSDTDGVAGYEEKVSWLRQVLEWHEELGGLGSLFEELNMEFDTGRVYVFSPKGHVYELPSDATPLDFAYRVHTDVGHCCQGARVNGRIVPLTTSLKSGDQVEILTSKVPSPSLDWLSAELGYLKTTRARQKVQQWFRARDVRENVETGKDLFDKQLRRLGLHIPDTHELAARMGFADPSALYAALGAGNIRFQRVLEALQQDRVEAEQKSARHQYLPESGKISLNQGSGKQPDTAPVTVEGISNLVAVMAHCCDPVPGDQIEGYVTMGKGISVHKSDCPNFLDMKSRRPERVMNVNWSAYDRGKVRFPARISLVCNDRAGLLHTITQQFVDARINLLSVNTRSNSKLAQASMEMEVETTGLDELSQLLTRLQQLPEVLVAERKAG
jgi:GTP pyrophosphokinase